MLILPLRVVSKGVLALAGPIVTSPPLQLDPSVLAGKDGDVDIAAVNNAMEAMLAERAHILEQLEKPEAARLEQAWSRLEPLLLAKAGVDEKTYREQVAAWQEELTATLELPAKDRPPALEKAMASQPPLSKDLAAAISASPSVKLAPGTSILETGNAPPRLVGLSDDDLLGALEAWLRDEADSNALNQTLHGAWPISGSTNCVIPLEDQLDPETGAFEIGVSNALIGWPHKLVALGAPFTVRETDTHVHLEATVADTGSSASVVAVGYSHAWSQLQMVVHGGAENGEVVSSELIEPQNVNVVVGGDQPAVPEGTVWRVRCSFDRRPGDPTRYVVYVIGTVDATVCGAAIAICYLAGDLEQITVQSYEDT